MRRRGWVGWCIEIKVTATSSCVENVFPHIRPEHAGDCPAVHECDTAVGSVQVFKHFRSEGDGYDWAVIEEDNLSNHQEGMAVLVVGEELLWPGCFVFRSSS